MAKKANDKKNTSSKCTYCKKAHHLAEGRRSGDSIGNGPKLGANILKKYYPGIKRHADHPLAATFKRGSNTVGRTAQAHHLICSAAMKKGWAKFCAVFGYDINHEKNGVFLPSSSPMGCDLFIPVHRGAHDYTRYEWEVKYTVAVKALINPILRTFDKEKLCDEKRDVVKELDDISKEIWGLVKSFTWTITKDGRDYAYWGVGCLGAQTSDGKKKSAIKNCNKFSLIGHGFKTVTGYFKEV